MLIHNSILSLIQSFNNNKHIFLDILKIIFKLVSHTKNKG